MTSPRIGIAAVRRKKPTLAKKALDASIAGWKLKPRFRASISGKLNVPGRHFYPQGTR
jgi:hypothetical protein